MDRLELDIALETLTRAARDVTKTDVTSEDFARLLSKLDEAVRWIDKVAPKYANYEDY